jgi:hypothetical protein
MEASCHLLASAAFPSGKPIFDHVFVLSFWIRAYDFKATLMLMVFIRCSVKVKNYPEYSVSTYGSTLSPSLLRGLAFLFSVYTDLDRLCGLVVRVLGYRSGGPGSIPGTTKKK